MRAMGRLVAPETPDRGTITFLAAALILATLLRVLRIETLPPAHYRDVALTAMDALGAAAGALRIHYTYDEGLFANLVGLVFKVAGASDASIRLTGAAAGILTCWAVRRLGRALGIGRAGAYGAGVLAVCLAHVVLSRSGFRAVLFPPLLALSVAFSVDAVRRRSPGRCLAGGGALGLAAHAYPAAWFAPLLLPFVAVWAARQPGIDRRLLVRGAGLFAAAALVVAAPILIDAVAHPEHVTTPHRIVSIFSPGLDPGDIPAHLGRNLVRTLEMFHLRGDENPRHNLPGRPLLDPFTGVLLIAGLISIGRDPRDAAGRWILLPWIGILSLPSLLSVEGVPHFLRSCGVLPAVALVAGVGAVSAERVLAARIGRRAAGVAMLGVLLIGGGWAGRLYFHDWASDPRVGPAHDAPLRAAARVLLRAPAGVGRFVLANGEGYPAYGHPIELQAYLFELRDSPPVVLGPKDTPRIVLGGQPAMVAFIRRDDRALSILRDLNPGATVEEVTGPELSPDSPVYRVWRAGGAAAP